jgi:hypothetical protein
MAPAAMMDNLICSATRCLAIQALAIWLTPGTATALAERRYMVGRATVAQIAMTAQSTLSAIAR